MIMLGDDGKVFKNHLFKWRGVDSVGAQLSVAGEKIKPDDGQCSTPLICVLLVICRRKHSSSTELSVTTHVRGLEFQHVKPPMSLGRLGL